MDYLESLLVSKQIMQKVHSERLSSVPVKMQTQQAKVTTYVLYPSWYPKNLQLAWLNEPKFYLKARKYGRRVENDAKLLRTLEVLKN